MKVLYIFFISTTYNTVMLIEKEKLHCCTSQQATSDWNLPRYWKKSPFIGDVIQRRFTFTLRQVHEIVASRVIAIPYLFVPLRCLIVAIRHKIIVFVFWRILQAKESVIYTVEYLINHKKALLQAMPA